MFAWHGLQGPGACCGMVSLCSSLLKGLPVCSLPVARIWSVALLSAGCLPATLTSSAGSELGLGAL